jgi:uncharacterized protein
MLRKAIPMEVKVNESKRIIEGYASTFGNRDRVGDIVQPGAFAKTLKERFNEGKKRDVKVLWQHFHPIGLPQHIEEDSKGLLTVSKIAPTPQGDEALILAKEGVVDKFSIGYDIVKSDYEGSAQLLHELKLYEYSLVTFPANEMADLTSVKNLGLGLGAGGIGQLEALLKDVGAADLTQLLKEGRTLSRATTAKILTAITALQELVDVSEIEPDEEDDEKHKQPPSNKGDDIDPQELQSILANFKSVLG